MNQRGRKSGAALEVVASIGTIVRPDPMPGLTVDQSNEWTDVVNRMPADWFPRETHSILAQYCRHVVSARRVDQLIESLIKSEPCDNCGEIKDVYFLRDYDRLLKMQEREGRAMSALATRMRLTQQSLVSKDRTKGGMKDKPPHLS